MNIRHSTITENQARFAGAGVFVEYPTVRIEDSIIAGNQVLDTGEFVDVDGDPNVAITVVSEGSNLIGSATTADASAALAAKSAFFAEESAGVA